LTQHNLTFYQDFMRALRDGIEAGVLDQKLSEFPIAAAEAEVS
jgi:queuine/archaeosine tRNA-ribosyltransferase